MSSRKSYRNKMIRKNLLEVSFVSAGKVVKGTLLDVHGSGAAAVFKNPIGRKLKSSMTGELLFSSPDGEETITLDVEIRSVREIRGGARVGFSFDSDMAFEIEWPETMRSLFNRRGAYRVHPRPREDVFVIIHSNKSHGGSIRGKLADISLTGARLKLEDELPWTDLPQEVRATFLLPKTQVRVMVRATLCNTYGKVSNQVGLKFKEDNSPRFGINQKEIREYIMQRQREDLRHMSWINARSTK